MLSSTPRTRSIRDKRTNNHRSLESPDFPSSPRRTLDSDTGDFVRLALRLAIVIQIILVCYPVIFNESVTSVNFFVA